MWKDGESSVFLTSIIARLEKGFSFLLESGVSSVG
jgi:hypothetical protein